MERITKIDIYDKEVRGGRSVLFAYIKQETGGLVVEGLDTGEIPMEFWGDEDYEYLLYVEPQDKERVLDALVQETLQKEEWINSWLDGMEIPRDYKGEGYGDTVMLLLIKTRFDTDVQFRNWLDSKGIPSQFDSWV